MGREVDDVGNLQTHVTCAAGQNVDQIPNQTRLRGVVGLHRRHWTRLIGSEHNFIRRGLRCRGRPTASLAETGVPSAHWDVSRSEPSCLRNVAGSGKA